MQAVQHAQHVVQAIAHTQGSIGAPAAQQLSNRLHLGLPAVLTAAQGTVEEVKGSAVHVQPPCQCWHLLPLPQCRVLLWTCCAVKEIQCCVLARLAYMPDMVKGKLGLAWLCTVLTRPPAPSWVQAGGSSVVH